MKKRDRKDFGRETHLHRTIIKQKVSKSDILNVFRYAVDKLPDLISLINQNPKIILKTGEEPFNEVPPEWDNFSANEIDDNAFSMGFFNQESVFEEKLTAGTLESILKQELLNENQVKS